MRFFLACFTSPSLLQPLQPPPSSSPPKTQQHRNGIPGSELLERLLVGGVVGIDVASEPASRDGEGGALDGLLHEERPLGRAGERSGARASCAADEGGDGHCEGVWCGVGGAEMGESGYYSLSCAALLGWAGLLRCRRRRIGSFRVGDLAGRGEHVPALVGRAGNVGLRLQFIVFCFLR